MGQDLSAYHLKVEERRNIMDKYLRRTYYYDNECIYLQCLNNFKLTCLVPACTTLFTNQTELIYHMETTHKIKIYLYQYKCVLFNCGRMFNELEELQKHVGEGHGNASCFFCKRCGKDFKLLQLLTNHDQEYERLFAMVSEQGRREQPTTAEANDEALNAAQASTIHRQYIISYLYFFQLLYLCRVHVYKYIIIDISICSQKLPIFSFTLAFLCRLIRYCVLMQFKIICLGRLRKSNRVQYFCILYVINAIVQYFRLTIVNI